MKIRHFRQGIVTMLAPEAPIIDDAIQEFRRKIDECAADGDQRLVIDLSKVTFIESAALELLVDKDRELSAQGGSLKIASPSDICRDVLRVTRLNRVLEVYDSLEEARRSFI